MIPPVTTPSEHPFATYVRAVGKGEKLGRTLDTAEAETAMGMILDGKVEPIQVGAFLIAIRYRKETPDELAGFARAARSRLGVPALVAVDLDWPSYADRHRQLPHFLLAVRLLAGNGVRIAMHGIEGDGLAGTRACLAALGIAPASDADGAARDLDRQHVAYLPVEDLCPTLARLFELRPLLGLRSPANTYARELNPFDAPCQVQGVFHPNYAALHGQAAAILDQPAAAIFKGIGGEAQRRPEKPCRVTWLRDGHLNEEDLPALLDEDRVAWREEPLDPARLAAYWRGDAEDPAVTASVVGTAGIALALLKTTATVAEGETLACDMWQARDRRQPSSAAA